MRKPAHLSRILPLLLLFLLPYSSSLLFSCHPSCSTCLGPNSNQCLTCTAGIVPTSGSCICPDGTYPASGLFACPTCNTACSTCTGGSSTSCTGCSSTQFLYQGSCYTNCTSSQYFNTATLACAACSTSCASCTGSSSSSCTSCTTGRFLYQNSCYTNCASSQFFSTSALACTSCSPACLTCTGPTATECTSCASGTLTNGECLCSSGQYKDPSYTCQTCHPTCRECSGGTSSTCTSCNTGMIFQGGQCKCSTGTYMTTSPVSCVACNSLCLGCTGPGTNECTSCKNNMVLASDGTCKCPSGKYFDSGSTSCLSCDSSCQECTGALSTQCSACKNNMQLSPTYTCGCPDGTYLDPSTMVCILCHSSCKKCSGPLSSECTDCDATFTLVSGQCKCSSGCTCPTGTYFDSGSLTCLNCDSSCKTCNGQASNQCTSCDSDKTLISGVCKCSGSTCTCPTGTYLDTTTYDCLPCNTGCLTCDGPASTDCLSCKNNLVLTSRECKCNSGSYLNTGINTCLACDTTCSTCSGSSTHCTVCKNNMLLSSTYTCGCGPATFPDWGTYTCDPCDSTCTACTGPDNGQCSSCISTKVLENNYCLQICNPDQFRASDGSCGQCYPTCATCSGSGMTQCNTCISGRIHATDGSCVTCHPSCATCSGAGSNECLSCTNSNDILDNGSCLPCYSTCATCSGTASTQCLTCVSGTVFDSGSCVTCDPSCATCSGAGPNKCLSCYSGADLISGTCINRCYSTCSSCVGPLQTQCTICKSGYVYFEVENSAGRCINTCPTDYYVTTKNGQKACLPKTGIDNILEYGSGVNQVKIAMGRNIATDFNVLASAVQCSFTFAQQQTSIEYTYQLSLSDDSKSIILTFTFTSNLLPGNILNINYNTFRDDSSTDFYLQNDQHKVSMMEYIPYSPAVQAAINATTAVNTAATQANGVFSIGSSFLANSIHSMRSEIVQDMLAYFIYMNIDFPPNFITFMNDSGGPFDLLFPNLGDSIIHVFIDSDDDDEVETAVVIGGNSGYLGNALDRFAPDRSFLSNNGTILFAFMLFTIIVLALELARFCLSKTDQTKKPALKRFLTKMFDSASYALRWNFLVNQYIGVYIDLTFFGLLQATHFVIKKRFIDYVQYISGIASFLTSFVGFVGIYFFTSRIYRMLLKNKDFLEEKEKEGENEAKEPKKDTKEITLLKRFELLYETFRKDRRIRLNYPFLLLVRTFGFSLVLIVCQAYPLIQVLYVLLTTILVLVYLIRYRPLESKIQQVLTVLYEGIFLLACILALALHIYNQANLGNITIRSNMGFALCACSLVMVFLNFASMFIELRKIGKVCKARRNKAKVQALAAQVSKVENEQVGILRSASALEVPDVTATKRESYKDISFTRLPSTNRPKQQGSQENFEEIDLLPSSVREGVIDMSPDLIVAKNILEGHRQQSQNELLSDRENHVALVNYIKKPQLFTKKSIHFEMDGRRNANNNTNNTNNSNSSNLLNLESRRPNLKLIKNRDGEEQELITGPLTFTPGEVKVFDYARESSERNLVRDRKKNLYRKIILRQRPMTATEAKELESNVLGNAQSTATLDIDKTELKNTNDEMSFGVSSRRWEELKSPDKGSDVFDKWKESDVDSEANIDKKMESNIFDKWKDNGEEKSEKGKSPFYIEISDLNFPSLTMLSSARSSLGLLSKRKQKKDDALSPNSGE